MNNINIEENKFNFLDNNNIINNNENNINKDNNLNEEYNNLNSEENNYDINQFKNIIYEQNYTLLKINIQELQKLLTNYLNQLDILDNNETYLLNLLKM